MPTSEPETFMFNTSFQYRPNLPKVDLTANISRSLNRELGYLLETNFNDNNIVFNPSEFRTGTPLDYLFALNNGVESACTNLGVAFFTTILHPVDTVKNLGTTIWDGYNAIADKAFGLSTEASRMRNDDRGTAALTLLDKFNDGDSVTKTQMITHGVTEFLLSAAATGAAMTPLLKIAKNRKMAKLNKSGAESALLELPIQCIEPVGQTNRMFFPILGEEVTIPPKVFLLSNEVPELVKPISGNVTPILSQFESGKTGHVKPLEERPRVKTKGNPEKQLTDIGLYKPVPISIEVEYSILDFQNKRNKYLKKYREIEVTGFPEEIQDLLKNTTADNSIRKNMTPDDLAGIFKEEAGIKIKNYKGEIAKHIYEGDGARNAVKNNITIIKARLKDLKDQDLSLSKEYTVLQEKLSDLSKVKDAYDKLRREAICLAEKNKSKP